MRASISLVESSTKRPADWEIRFPEAVEPLLTLALMKRDKNARMQYDVANKYQVYHHWNKCNHYLQHVLKLEDKFKEERRRSKTFEASSSFRQLLADCQRYVTGQRVLDLTCVADVRKDTFYEINALPDLNDVCEVNLQAVEIMTDRKTAVNVKASTLSHQASMYESIGKVEQAIGLITQGRNMHLPEGPIKGGLLGGFEQNLGYNYNMANQHEESLK
nr:hypothetical protein CFP56_63555 [Quercus suber]